MWDRQKAQRGIELLEEALSLLDAVGAAEAAAYTSMAIETVGGRLRDDEDITVAMPACSSELG